MGSSRPLVGKRKLLQIIQDKQLELITDLIKNCKSLEELDTAVEEYNRLYNANVKTKARDKADALRVSTKAKESLMNNLTFDFGKEKK